MKYKNLRKWLKFENIRFFYLGFLASIGLFAMSFFLVFMSVRLLEEFMDIFLQDIAFKIIFSLFYLTSLAFTYRIIKGEITLRNGFLLFAIVAILSHIHLWILAPFLT